MFMPTVLGRCDRVGTLFSRIAALKRINMYDLADRALLTDHASGESGQSAGGSEEP
jgi:hypothetical protein